MMHRDKQKHLQPISGKYLNQSDSIAPFRIDIQRDDEAKKSSPFGTALGHRVFCVIQEILPEFLLGLELQETAQDEADLKNKIVIQKLTGGLSNHLLVVSRKDVDTRKEEKSEDADDGLLIPSKILVRINAGENMDQETNGVDVDSDMENKISALLSIHGSAPAYYGRFENGRLEEFYDSMRTLSCREMLTKGGENECEYKFNRFIAMKMARFHKFKLPESLLAHDHTNDNMKVDMDGNQENGDIWNRIHGWIQTLQRANNDSSSSSLTDIAVDSAVQRAGIELSWLQRELGFQQKKNDSLPSTTASEASHTRLSMDDIRERAQKFMREIIFAHMDLQSLNILTPTRDNHDHNNHDIIRLIDFEYAGMNARSIDIANTFLECCDMNNLKPDYEAEYPTCEEQNVFLETYVREYDPMLAKELDGIGGGSDGCNLGSDDMEGALLWGEFLSTARAEVGKATLVSHLGWACWSMVQLQESTIDFDFAKYAEIRWDGYNLFKTKYFE